MAFAPGDRDGIELRILGFRHACSRDFDSKVWKAGDFRALCVGFGGKKGRLLARHQACLQKTTYFVARVAGMRYRTMSLFEKEKSRWTCMNAFGVRCVVCVIVASSSPSFHTLILSFIQSLQS